MADPLFLVPLEMLVYISQSTYGDVTVYRWRCDVNSIAGTEDGDCETEFSYHDRDMAVQNAVTHLRAQHGLLPFGAETRPR